MKARVLKKAYLLLSSPRLTLGILMYAVVLVFVGTIAQTEIGVSEAQAKYFESFFVLANFGAVKFPLVGGALVGIFAVVNIVLSAMRFCKFGLRGLGVSITHVALALLVVSGGLQYFLRVEGSLVLRPSQKTNMVVLAGKVSRVVSLPFFVTLKEFKEEKWEGSAIAKNYYSDIVFTRGNQKVEARTSMNSPASFAGWTFYQMSYGKDGSSVIGAVKNPARLLPWLAVGATFVGMLIIFLPRVLGKNYYEK